MWVGTTPFFKGTGAHCGGQTQCESSVYLRHRDPAPYFAAATAAHPRRGLRCAAASVPVCHGVPVARRPGRRSVAARRRPGPAGARGVCRVFVFTKDTGSSPTSTCALSGANPGQPERAPRPNLPVIGQPGRGGRGLLVTRTHPSCVCVECLFSRTPSFLRVRSHLSVGPLISVPVPVPGAFGLQSLGHGVAPKAGRRPAGRPGALVFQVGGCPGPFPPVSESLVGPAAAGRRPGRRP